MHFKVNFSATVSLPSLHLLSYNDITAQVSLDASLLVMVASIGRRHASRQPPSTSSVPHRHTDCPDARYNSAPPDSHAGNSRALSPSHVNAAALPFRSFPTLVLFNQFCRKKKKKKSHTVVNRVYGVRRMADIVFNQL